MKEWHIFMTFTQSLDIWNNKLKQKLASSAHLSLSQEQLSCSSVFVFMTSATMFSFFIGVEENLISQEHHQVEVLASGVGFLNICVLLAHYLIILVHGITSINSGSLKWASVLWCTMNNSLTLSLWGYVQKFSITTLSDIIYLNNLY